MKTSELDYNFPEELTAQEPLKDRDSSRLFIVNRETKKFTHSFIKNIPDYLNSGDLLVINDSKVLPARLFGKRISGGEHEILLVKKLDEDFLWEVIATNSKKIKPNSLIKFNKDLEAVCIKKIEDRFILRFNIKGEFFYRILNEIGKMPLPPYIKRDSNVDDITRYQTVYAKNIGSSAAPTAGFHFTNELIDKIKAKGVNIANVTLHVSLDTFLPVREENINDHIIHGENIIVTKNTADLINKTKKAGKRIVAIGTTSVRAIESCFDEKFGATPVDKETRLFITEGYEFKLVDAIVTNFHRPKSTLLALISSFAGHKLIMSAYKEAVDNKYRLFSYGDSMLII